MARWQVVTSRSPATYYHAMVEAESAADAVTWLGDKIRANDLAGVHVLGEHVEVPPGEDAGLTDVSAVELEAGADMILDVAPGSLRDGQHRLSFLRTAAMDRKNEKNYYVQHDGVNYIREHYNIDLREKLIPVKSDFKPEEPHNRHIRLAALGAVSIALDLLQTRTDMSQIAAREIGALTSFMHEVSGSYATQALRLLSTPSGPGQSVQRIAQLAHAEQAYRKALDHAMLPFTDG